MGQREQNWPARMKQRSKHHLLGIGVTVPFVIAGWCFLFVGEFKWVLIDIGACAVFLSLLSLFLSRGHKRSWCRDSPWGKFRLRIGQPVSAIQDLLGTMQEDDVKERKSFLGQRLTNKLHSVEYPGKEGTWRLSIETCNDNVTAYSVAFTSEVSPSLDCGELASGSKTWFLRTADG